MHQSFETPVQGTKFPAEREQQDKGNVGSGDESGMRLSWDFLLCGKTGNI